MKTRFSYYTEYAFDAMSSDYTAPIDAPVLLELCVPGDDTICRVIDPEAFEESPADLDWKILNMDQVVLEHLARHYDRYTDPETRFYESQMAMARTAKIIDASAWAVFDAAVAHGCSWLPDVYASDFYSHVVKEISESMALMQVMDGDSANLEKKFSDRIDSLVSYMARREDAKILGNGIGWCHTDGLRHYTNLPAHRVDRSPEKYPEAGYQSAISRATNLRNRLNVRLKKIGWKDQKQMKKATLRSLKLCEKVFGKASVEAINAGAKLSFKGEHVEFRFGLTDVFAAGHGGFTLTCHDKDTGEYAGDLCVYIPDTPPLDQAVAFKTIVDAEGEDSLIDQGNLTLASSESKLVRILKTKRDTRLARKSGDPDIISYFAKFKVDRERANALAPSLVPKIQSMFSDAARLYKRPSSLSGLFIDVDYIRCLPMLASLSVEQIAYRDRRIVTSISHRDLRTESV